MMVKITFKNLYQKSCKYIHRESMKIGASLSFDTLLLSGIVFHGQCHIYLTTKQATDHTEYIIINENRHCPDQTLNT